ncbi:MAG: 2-C-methyl-D-erythritol 4-phosphate cytidylyltransferase [Lachnospiraceae bacterium]|nr:2-C-methyl-D-erythritol 4-phosphate cytidylyltransferase [Candidatus Equihabitans merdae]
MKNIAIILAAGKGKRMKTNTPKQFLNMGGEPMLVKCVRVFEESNVIDEIVLVCSEKHKDECKKLTKGFRKVKSLVIGGKERYDSVYEGLKACRNCRYVFIHDAARPYVTTEILNRVYQAVKEFPACVVGMPVKDTIKVVDGDGFVTMTPDRAHVWMTQTPQVFRYDLVKESYDIMMKRGVKGFTDDAAVVEAAGLSRVKLVEGSYDNIKITTSDDLDEDGDVKVKAAKEEKAAKEDKAKKADKKDKKKK